MRSHIRAFEKLSTNSVFSTGYRASRQVLMRVTNLREFLSHLSAESRLARIARMYEFDVKLKTRPDLVIGNKSVEVKKLIEIFILPEKHGPFTPITNESTEIENLSNVIIDGLRQDADIIAIEVNHLDKRKTRGFKSKWFGTASLKQALATAVNYHRKGLVLLFKTGSSGMNGRLIIVSKMRKN
jgi:hypothetical protein